MSNKMQAVFFVVVVVGTSYWWGQWWGESFGTYLLGLIIGAGTWRFMNYLVDKLKRIYHARRMEARHRRNSGGFGGLTGSATRDIESLVQRDIEESPDEEGDTNQPDEAQPDPNVRNLNDTRIIVASRAPNPDPDYEECDVWVNTALKPPHVYVRHDHEDRLPPVWHSTGQVHQRGKVFVCNQDTVVMMTTARREGLNDAVRNLVNADDEILTAKTMGVLDTLDPVLREELMVMTGPHDEPDEEDAEPPGRRMIDVG